MELNCRSKTVVALKLTAVRRCCTCQCTASISNKPLDRNNAHLSTLIKILFPFNRRSTTTWFAFFVVLFCGADQVMTYLVGIMPSLFYVALGNKDETSFKFLCAKGSLIIIGKAFSLALVKFMTSFLSIKCRELCNLTLHRLYFKRQAFFKLSSSSNAYDNPDQRMTQDIEKTTRLLSCDLLAPVLTAPFIIGYYSYLTYDGSGWFGIASIFVYFIIQTVANKFMLSPMVSLVSEQEKKEGDFRQRHMEVRSNIEAIAFTEPEFWKKLQKKLTEWRFALGFMTNIFDYFGGILSYLIIGIPVFITHQYDHMSGPELNGVVSRNSFYYLYLIYSFSTVLKLAENFGELAGVTHRVIELYEELQRLHSDCLETDRPPSTVPSSVVVIASDDEDKASRTVEEIHGKQLSLERDEQEEEEAQYLLGGRNSDEEWPDDGVALTIDSASLAPPNETPNIIVQLLSLQLIQGQSLLITGESGCGKTSLFRMFAGLLALHRWKSRLSLAPTDPKLAVPAPEALLSFGGPLAVEKDVARLASILGIVRLEYLIDRCGGFDNPVDWDWMKQLSPGELQRLSLARVFYTHPRIVFLDESTSAMGFDMEMHIYKKLQEEKITFVSIGHRYSLKQFHDMELRLKGRGGEWTLHDIDSASIASRTASFLGTDTVLSMCVKEMVILYWLTSDICLDSMTDHSHKDVASVTPFERGVHFSAGVVSGAAGVLAGHPLDTVKVRLQTQQPGQALYRGTFHCLRKILHQEGFRGLYKGLSSPLASLSAINAIVFGVHGSTSREFANPNSLKAHFCAGAAAGLAQSIIATPTERIKLLLQIQNDSAHTKFRGPVHAIRELARTQGISTFSRGFLATVARDGPAFGIYFASYEWMARSMSVDGRMESLTSAQLLLAG
ncbi:unnamed protein product, partial [Caenorhabditis auriculariae]